MPKEESFRDLKNTRYGLGLRHCRSYQTDRLNIALLIAALAILVLWLFGVAAKVQNLHYTFQTNTVKTRNVLSDMFIGWQVMLRNEVKFTKRQLLSALVIVRDTTDGELLNELFCGDPSGSRAN